jgi:O-antigen/teichoic acid export membrane protein
MNITPVNTSIPKLDLSRYYRLAKEGIWIVVGQIATVLGGLVLVRVLTEYLDPAQYGQLALGLTVASLVNQVVLGGISGGISRFYSIAIEKQNLSGYMRDSRRILSYGMLVVVIIGIVLMGGLLWLRYSRWMGLAAVALVFSMLSGFNSTLSGIQEAARQRAVVAFHGGLDAWLKILLAIGVMLWLGNTSIAVVLGYCCSTLLVTVSQLFFLRRTIPQMGMGAEGPPQFIQQMWSYSWPFSAWGLFTWAQQVSDRWALVAFATQKDVGMYSVVFQLGYGSIAIITSLFITFLGPILYQRTGDATNQARNVNVHRLVWRITLISLMVTLVGVVITFTMHELIFRLLVATEYRGISYLLPWLVMAGGMFAAGQMLSLKLMSEMKSAKMISAKIGTALLGVTFNIYGAYVAGIQGVVGALIAFSTIYLAWMILLAYRSPHINYN